MIKRNKKAINKIKNRSKKKYLVMLSCTFVLIIGLLSIINYFKSDKEISILENRKLKQKPEFSIQTLMDGNFTKEFEEYVSDQFVFRDQWIKLKATMEIMSSKNKINDVFIGKDNYLLEDFKREKPENTENKINIINEFGDKNSKLNISFMLVPTATKIWEDKLPANADVDDQYEFIKDIKGKLNKNINFIDVYDALQQRKDEDIYYKTDHHWTTKGAYIAYKYMCNQLKLKPKNEDEFHVETVTNDFYGSLYYKMGAGIGNPDSIQVYAPNKDSDYIVNYVEEGKKIPSLYDSSKLDGKDKYDVFMSGNHSLVNIKTLGDHNKKLLIIKDSYANSLIPFLTDNYGEITVVDLRYYTDSLKELNKTYGFTDVLFLFNVNTFNSDNSILNLDT